jgi:hypothetical protein
MVNDTFPVGGISGEVSDVMLAVNLTVWPNTEGFIEEVTVVKVVAFCTVWSTVLEDDEVKFESPLYVAVTECVPASKFRVAYEACPLLTGRVTVGPPVIVNVTIPVGVPPPGATGATVAVKITF